MTLLIAPATPAPRAFRPVRRGWRPRYEGEFPTLGWQVLDWTHAFLPSPADDHDPFVYTDEQARRVLEWFRLNPRTGAFVYGRRLHLQEAKGFGKSPFAASLDLAEFCGPVCFDGWDADGRPVGVPWGTGRRPAPWIQIAGISKASTKNTYSTVYSMLTANSHRAATDLRIDEGRTRLYLRDVPKALMEPVTASAGSREGQPLTAATVDEPQLLLPEDGGQELVETILANLTKMNGRAVFTGNAYIKGQDSVAEHFDVEEAGVLRYARRPSVIPEQDWPVARLVASLREVYIDAPWAPLKRIVADAIAPTANWPRARRLFWNIPSDATEDPWIDTDVWTDCAGEVVLRKDVATYAVITVSHDHESAAVAVAQQQGERILLHVRTFPESRVAAGDLVPVPALEDHLRDLHRRYPAHVLAAKRYHPRAKEHLIPARGPEIVYHGSFFEGSAQKLRAEGLVLVDMPDSQERLAPASESLKAAAIEGRLVHEDDHELGRQIGNVMASEAVKGWKISEAGPAARAAMVAVQRALVAKRPQRVTMRRDWTPR